MVCPIRLRYILTVFFISILYPAACSEPQEQSLDRIRQNGRIRLAVRAPSPPFSCFDAQGELHGFDVDVAQTLAERLNVGLEIFVAEWKDIVQGLMEGRYDGIVGSIAITPERQQVVNFTEPYYHSALQVLVHRDSDLQNLADLKGKRIALAEGANYQGDARHLGASEILFFNSGYRILEALNQGQIDATIVDRVVGAHMIRYDQQQVQLLGSPLRNEQVAIAVRKEDRGLLDKLNTILKSLQADGTLEKLMKKVAEGQYDCKGR